MDQLKLYIHLLELIIEEQDLQIQQMEKELLVFSKIFLDRNIPFDAIPNISKCSLCGLDLSGVMGYCCPNLKCPTGLGPVYCKT
jgi:hypothetical protein